MSFKERIEREDLLKSKIYWTEMIQLDLFNVVRKYLEDNKMSKKDFAQKINKTKGYVSQVLNGDFDHRISKLVELSLAAGKVPRVEFVDIEKILELDEKGELYPETKQIQKQLQEQKGSLETTPNEK